MAEEEDSKVSVSRYKPQRCNFY